MQSHLPFVLLKPIKHVIKEEDIDIISVKDVSECDDIWTRFTDWDTGLVLDIETKGNKAHDLDCKVVMVSFSDSRGALAIDLRDSHPDTWRYILHGLYVNKIPLVAHNVNYDAAFIFRDYNYIIPGKDPELLTTKHWHNWRYCTYGAFRHLATEGWLGQRWGLKQAQVDLLGWEAKGDEELDAWLCDNNYGRWVSSKKGTKKAQAQKGEMWRIPKEILGKYCALDSYSTQALLVKVLLPVMKKFKAYEEYHTKYFINLVKLVITQQLGGILINKDRLIEYNKELLIKKAATEQEFLNHIDVKPHVDYFKQYILDEHAKLEPPKYKGNKKTKEPNKYTKKGAISKSWEAWSARQQVDPELTHRWKVWRQKYYELESTPCFFNIASNSDCKWLYYDRMNYPVLVTTDNENNPQPAVDEDARKGFGEVGELHSKWAELMKEQGYVQACIDAIGEGTILYPQFKVPGTLTGRIAGTGGINIAQVPKTEGYLSNWIARPGCKFLCFDFKALEMVVQAALTRDKSMLALYGPDAKENDIYLFCAAQIDALKEPIIACGYDPYNPTKEAVSKAKKECKRVRQIAKVLVLSSSYGAGPNKIRNELGLEKIYLTLKEVQDIHAQFWDLFSGIKAYEKFLINRWEHNNGWVLNGIGRPIGVNEGYIKDIVNRVVQSTGHSILELYLQIVEEELTSRRIPHHYAITDWHDATMVEVKDEFIAATVEVLDVVALDKLNKLLSNDVIMGGKTNVVDNLADDKCE